MFLQMGTRGLVETRKSLGYRMRKKLVAFPLTEVFYHIINLNALSPPLSYSKYEFTSWHGHGTLELLHPFFIIMRIYRERSARVRCIPTWRRELLTECGPMRENGYRICHHLYYLWICWYGLTIWIVMLNSCVSRVILLSQKCISMAK